MDVAACMQVCDPPDGPSYSLHLKQLQKVLMTVDPARRPSIEEVGKEGAAGCVRGAGGQSWEREQCSTSLVGQPLLSVTQGLHLNALCLDGDTHSILASPGATWHANIAQRCPVFFLYTGGSAHIWPADECTGQAGRQ
jgi:hypothetical protein